MNYTSEQLEKLMRNIIGINNRALEVLGIIRDGEISNGEVFSKAGLSKFVADKCIIAFLAAGLVEMSLNGVSRYYKITTDGERLLEKYEESGR